MTQQQNTGCDLCGLKLPNHPPTTEWKGKEHQFCCMGCRQIFTILAESGLLEGDYKNSDIYQTSLKLGIIPQPAPDLGGEKTKQKFYGGAGGGFSKEPPARRRQNLENAPLPKDAKELDLQLSGMWCSACSWLIDKVVSAEKGVLQTQVLFAADSAKIRYLPQVISAEEIKNRIKKLGYGATERSEPTDETLKERSQLLLRMGIAVFIALNVMMLNTVLYVGYFETISTEIARLIPFVLWAFATPAVSWCAFPVHKKAFHSLRARAPTMETLLSVGILTAYFYSIYALSRQSIHIYFDTSANLVALVLVGKFLETAARHKAAGGIQRLYSMLPQKVRLKTDRGERLVSIEQLQVDDLFIVKPGEKIPADGIIMSGTTAVDESLLTGEAKPAPKKENQKVVGSSLNLSGIIEVKTTHTGETTTLARIIKLVENALAQKSPIERLVDRISRWFIPAVFLVSFVTFTFLFSMGANLETAVMRGLTVLVIACPCALGIATPLALMAGMGYASRRGILVRDGSVFQQAAKLDAVFFDKTGTITAGKFAVLEHHTVPTGANRESLQFIGALEKASNHPIAAAITNYCRQQHIKPFAGKEVVFYEGLGLKGKVKGLTVKIGSRRFFSDSQVSLPGELLEAGHRRELEGHTVVYYFIEKRTSPAPYEGSGESSSDRVEPEVSSFNKLSRNKEDNTAGLIVLGDRLQPHAAEATAALKQQNLSLHLISGDSQNTTRAIANQVGIADFAGQLSPQDKIAAIEKARAAGQSVAMVGDGINDAPALARADLGIAIGSGTELAIESADMILLSSDLRRVPDSLEIAARTMRTIKQNLTWAFFYNSVGIVIAVLGYLNPLIAAGAMLVSSISVVANSLRLHAGPGETRRRLMEILLPWIEPKQKS